MKVPCFYCGTRVKEKHLTRDHVFPKSRGWNLGVPLQGVANTVDACRNCNREKKNLLLEQYRLIKLGSSNRRFPGELQTIGRPDINNGVNFKTLEEQRWIIAFAEMQEALCS